MDEVLRECMERLEEEGRLAKEQWTQLIAGMDEELRDFAAEKARRISRSFFGNKIYLRGLIEFTNYCRNNCYYCGIRRSNEAVHRYRLTREDILLCCEAGWRLKYHTFALQGGEDGFYSDIWYEETIREIKRRYPECAVTLSIGERSRESYQRLFDAGADRYLLRHETAQEEHYRKLHPPELSLAHRKQCLYDLKEIGYQVGCGFMVGSPCQTPEQLAEDMIFIHELAPDMVGIGPFLPAQNTPFGDREPGGFEQTLFLLSLLRIMEKDILLPATTALGTIHPRGRELGILAGANVVMPNLSPEEVRGKYTLYDNKLCTGEEAAEQRDSLRRRVEAIGYEIEDSRGDRLKQKSNSK